MSQFDFSFGAGAPVTANYCEVNDHLMLRRGDHVVSSQYVDEITDIWGPEARALELLGHRLGRVFALRRTLCGGPESELGRLRARRCAGFAGITFWAEGRVCHA